MQFRRLAVVEPVRGEFGVVDPVGSAEPGLQVREVEGFAGMAAAECFDVEQAPAARCGIRVDEIAGESMVGERAPWSRPCLRGTAPDRVQWSPGDATGLP